MLNFEEGAEYAISEGDAHNEAVYEVIDRLPDIPDPCLQSHFDYGTRVGWWRIMQVMQDFAVPCTVSACGAAIARLPELAQDAMQRGHEISAHGWRWESHARMGIEEELRNIRRTVQAIEQATGQRPLGWHTRSASSPNTRLLLMQEGFVYDSDFYGDDLPILTHTPRAPLTWSCPMRLIPTTCSFSTPSGFLPPMSLPNMSSPLLTGCGKRGSSAQNAFYRIAPQNVRTSRAHCGFAAHFGTHQNKGQIWVARRDAIAKHWLIQDLA